MDTIALRPVEIADAAAVASLLGELGYPTTIDAAQRRLRVILSDPGYAAFVAADRSSCVGFACAHLFQPVEHDRPVALMTALVVANRSRRKGVGRRLLDVLSAWASERGCARIIVNSGLHRTEAHAFYLQCRFQETGKRFVRSLT